MLLGHASKDTSLSEGCLEEQEYHLLLCTQVLKCFFCFSFLKLLSATILFDNKSLSCLSKSGNNGV